MLSPRAIAADLWNAARLPPESPSAREHRAATIAASLVVVRGMPPHLAVLVTDLERPRE